MNKRIIIVSLAVFCAVLTVVAIIYHASIQNASPNPTSTPSPSPTPPTAEWGYMPVEYFNTLSSTGFDNIDPLSNKAEGQVTFTISKEKRASQCWMFNPFIHCFLTYHHLEISTSPITVTMNHCPMGLPSLLTQQMLQLTRNKELK